MRVIIQRVSEASVTVDNKIVGQIDKGFVLLVGFTHGDTIEDLNYIVKKIKFIRLFDDENGIMNVDINNSGGSILSISQFTLHANTSKGRRPSYDMAMKYDESKALYEKFNELLRSEGLKVQEGVFGADMKVSLINDGPVTIIIDSKEGCYEKNKL
ncbi:MAG TPA: D-tyrosyl-tRNA(Tyr) deacylase [Mollicutes bacterium]|nr:D-tyrosyl-tRNA(Tyr) deacylase [Mollicutes bacterium]